MAYVWQKDLPSPPKILDILVKTTSGAFKQDLHHDGPEIFSPQWYPEYGEGGLVSQLAQALYLTHTPTGWIQVYAYVAIIYM